MGCCKRHAVYMCACMCVCLSEKRQAAEADKALLSDVATQAHVYTIAQASKCSGLLLIILCINVREHVSFQVEKESTW